MIDRIVPAMTSAAITTEPFNQWVIENDAIAPLFAGSGVKFVPDVKPYELAKIRLFNGVHSTLAYIGEVEGIEFVANAIVHPTIAPFIQALQEREMAPSIADTGGIDLISYGATIRKRISNPTLRHRAHQIAMDGSQKMQQRIFDGANELASQGKSAALHQAAIAIWIHFLATNTEIDDPLAHKLTPQAQISDPQEAVTQTLMLPEFTRKLDPGLFPAIAEYLEIIRSTSVLDLISEVGFDETYGARPLKRAIQDKVEDFISEEVLKGTVLEDVSYVLYVDNTEVKLKTVKKTKAVGFKR